MEEDSVDVAALERRIEYLSVQIERLIELHSPCLLYTSDAADE